MQKLYLGVGREIITPKVGGQLYGYTPDVFSTSVNDDLTVSAFYLRQGDTQALMISATVCLISTALADEILTKIQNEYNIPKTCCILSATHTHSGPNTAGKVGWGDIDREYCEGIFIPRILSAVRAAVADPVPVKMGISSGDSLVGINRRELNYENAIKFGQNPWGAYDPKMTVISFKGEDKKTVASIVHYGCHGTAAGKNREITRDWSGIMTDALGGVSAFFNGPEGDVGPRISNGKTVGDITYVRELGEIAARDAATLYDKTDAYRDATLLTSHRVLEIPLCRRISKAEALKMLEPLKGQTVNHRGMTRAHLEQVLRSYEQGYADKEFCEVPQTLIAIGDIVFASFPYELFSEIGMRIGKEVKTKTVLSLSNTNGSEGYFVTEDALCRGGYEVTMFLYGHLQRCVDNADFHLMRESVKHIKDLINEE